MTPSNPTWPSDAAWDAAKNRVVHAHPTRWPEAEEARKLVRDILSSGGGLGVEEARVAFDVRLLVSNLTTTPAQVTTDIKQAIESLADRCDSLSSGPKSSMTALGRALRKLSCSRSPIVERCEKIIGAALDEGLTIQVLLPPSAPPLYRAAVKEWILPKYPGVAIAEYVTMRAARVTDEAIVTGTPRRYGSDGHRYDPNGDLRGSWIAHAAPAATVHVVSEPFEVQTGILVGLPDAYRLRINCVEGEPSYTRAEGESSADVEYQTERASSKLPLPEPSAPGPGESAIDAARVLLSCGSQMFLSPIDPKAVLAISDETLVQAGLSSSGGPYKLEVGTQAVLREAGTSERHAINERAYSKLGEEDRARARELLEELQSSSSKQLSDGSDALRREQKAYLRGWAAETLCFPTKHLTEGRKVANEAMGRPLSPAEEELLRKVRVQRQLAGKEILAEVKEALGDRAQGWSDTESEDIETAAGIFQLRTVVSIDHESTFKVSPHMLGCIYRGGSR